MRKGIIIQCTCFMWTFTYFMRDLVSLDNLEPTDKKNYLVIKLTR